MWDAEEREMGPGYKVLIFSRGLTKGSLHKSSDIAKLDDGTG